MLMDGVTGIADYQARQLLDDRYHRLQVVFDPGENIPLDAVDKMDRMEQIAAGCKTEMAETIDWISKTWS
ncbi:MAG: hypothetical protein AB1724_07580 [Thermodesulfobacteriota bacterium]